MISNKPMSQNTKIFRNSLELTGEGYNSNTSNNFADGAKITVFIMEKILEYTIKCSNQNFLPTCNNWNYNMFE